MNQHITPHIEFHQVVLDARTDAQILLATAFPAENPPNADDRIALFNRLRKLGLETELTDSEGWWLSRSALLAALESVDQVPAVFSLSHTSGIGVAAVGNCQGIGVDVEIKGRICSPRLANRIRNQVKGATSDMQAWCLLEAVFKADDHQQKIGVFAYTTTQTGDHFRVVERERLTARLIPHESFVIAVCARM